MSKPKIAAIIECRMTSSRLPGKVLLESCGKSMLEHLVERLKNVAQLDEVIFATTINSQDDVIVELAEKLNINCYRGSEEDVLIRVLETARKFEVDTIVEITGDCPLMDPEIVEQTIDLYLNNKCEYVSNDLNETYPLGMNVEVFSTELLEVANRKGNTSDDREHVSWYFIRNPEKFKLLVLPAPRKLNWPDLRLTLDEEADYKLIDLIFNELYSEKKIFNLYDIIDFLKQNPEKTKINSSVKQRYVSEN